jgi:hypothetical protein
MRAADHEARGAFAARRRRRSFALALSVIAAHSARERTLPTPGSKS